VEKILGEYANMVYKLAFSYVKNKDDADDIFQEVFINIIRSDPSFESKEHEKAWLIRTTINCCKNYKNTRWEKNVAILYGNEEQNVDDMGLLGQSNPIEEMLSANQYESVSEAVLSLSEKYRVVIHLYYYEEFNINEIAKILGKKENAIATRLSRARAKLKEMLKGEYDYEEI